MNLVVASSNIKKLKELNEILSNTIFNIRSLTSDEEIDVLEDGLTFKDNAIKKAYTYAKRLNEVVIADDSGLCVKALNNRPGIYSKRYSGKGDLENNLKILDELKNQKNRYANFVCLIAVVFPDGKTFTYEGIWEGRISTEISGITGFGYDPIFIPMNQNKTVASLDNEYKMNHSHRFKAIKKMLEDKDEIINYWRYTWQK